MIFRIFILQTFFCLVCNLTHGKSCVDCDFQIHGTVLDHQNHEPVVGAVVSIQGLNDKNLTDEFGHFHFNKVCSGSVVLEIKSLGFQSVTKNIVVNSDLDLVFHLEDNEHSTSEVQINTSQVRTDPSLSGQVLQDGDLEATRGLNLADALKSIAGVSVLQTGPTVSKPMIRGMSGNRIVILNNGVRQEGQQWGSEHAPEVDAFTADRLIVVKGAQSLRYGGDAIGGVIIVEPEELPKQRGISGYASTFGSSNSGMFGVAAQIQGTMPTIKGLAWRGQFSAKKTGDSRTPQYVLANTAMQELNGSATVGYEKRHFISEVYYSFYSTRIGVFKHSHIGSVGDLQSVLAKPDTMYQDKFSYAIERPYQQIAHHLLKSKINYAMDGLGKISLIASYQLDIRDEYDTHLRLKLSNPNAPELSFRLRTYQYDLSYEPNVKGNWARRLGMSYGTQSNVSEGRQLIPNFRNYTLAAYWLERYSKGNWLWEIGARYDYRFLQAYQVVGNLLRKPTYNFSNVSAATGFVHTGNTLLSKVNVATGWRAPTVSEFFSNGIHHGTASYEVGDSALKPERSYSGSLTVAKEQGRLTGEVSMYMNYMKDYIYLQPAYPVTQLTISGSFPLFNYMQADVIFRGIDGQVEYQIHKNIAVNGKVAVLRTWNFSAKDFLIFTPSDRYNLGLDYGLVSNKGVSIHFKPEIMWARYQNRTPQNVDFAPAPSGYVLCNASFQAVIPSRGSNIYLTISANNLFNTSYREYLNRLRYYSYETGANLIVQINIPFRALTK